MTRAFLFASAAAFLFAGLDSGARFLSGDFNAELARSLATIIQGMIILLVGGELLLRWLAKRALRGEPPKPGELPPGPADGPVITTPGGLAS